MKKILVSIFSLMMMFSVCFAFVGCDNYSDKIYNLTAITISKDSTGVECDDYDYKTFYGQSYINAIITVTKSTVTDVATFKAFLVNVFAERYEFKKDGTFGYYNKTTFATDETLNKKEFELSQDTYSCLVGKFSTEKKALNLLFANYKMSGKNYALDENQNKIVEYTALLNETTFVVETASKEFTVTQGIKKNGVLYKVEKTYTLAK